MPMDTKDNLTPHEAVNNDEDEVVEAPQPSAIAKAIETLKRASVDAAASRERLPQPLFWSLFNSRLKEIKREKLVDRTLRDVFEK